MPNQAQTAAEIVQRVLGTVTGAISQPTEFDAGAEVTHVEGTRPEDNEDVGRQQQAQQSSYVDYGAPIEEQMQGWEDSVAIRGRNGSTAYINPKTGTTAFPKDWRDSYHPVMRPGIDAETAKKLAAQTMEFNKSQAMRSRDAAIKAAADTVTSSVVPQAEQAGASQAAAPRLVPKFTAREGEAPASLPQTAMPNQPANASDPNAGLQPAGVSQSNPQGSNNQSPQYRMKASVRGTASAQTGGSAFPSSQSAASAAVSASIPSNSPIAQKQTEATEKEKKRSERKQIEKLAKEESKKAIESARKLNDKLDAEELAEWKKANPGKSEDEFVPSRKGHDAEAFEDSAGSMVRQFSNAANGPNSRGTKFREEKRKWKLIDRVMSAFQMGFFHIQGEKLEYDKNGKPHIRYKSVDVHDAFEDMFATFGLRGLKGRRTVFRLVMMYASMSVDRKGKMFNEDSKEWSMSADDFCRICRLIIASAKRNNGNPMCLPVNDEKLGGTSIFPCGVMPSSVASVLCNPRNTTLPAGTKPSDLIQACQDYWTSKTYPKMQTMLAEGMKPSKRRHRRKDKDGKKSGKNAYEEYRKNLTAQRIVVENFLEAIARLDGLSIEDISDRYKVDASAHYILEEYRDADKVYAQAMRGNYDADMVVKRSNAKCDAWEKKLKRGRFETVSNGNDDVSFGAVKRRGSFEAGMRVVTKAIRANALFLQLPIIIGNIIQKGVNNIQTRITLSLMLGSNGRANGYEMSEAAVKRLKSDEFVKAMTAAKLMMEIAGPGGCRLFARSGRPLTEKDVIEFSKENFLPDSSSETMAAFERFVDKAISKVMTGDLSFKRSDNLNWWRGLMVHNDRHRRQQAKLAESGKEDQYGMSFTEQELEDMLLHQDPERFLASMMGDDSGLDAYTLMRGNNIGNNNPVSYTVKQYLNRHGVQEGLVTIFIDNFPRYGLDLLLSMIPFSKTITYVWAKRESNANKATSTDLVIGGNMSERQKVFKGEGFDEGLRMNLWYDGVMFARQAIVMPFIIAAVMVLQGYEPPEDKRNLFNPSMWRVGGEEFHLAYWTNDITLWSLPLAHYFACILSGYNDQDLGQGDKNLAGELLMNSLYEQVDGNVLLDLANVFKNWQVDIAELKQMAEEPGYESDLITPSSATMLFCEYMMNVANKITPGAPLYRTAKDSVFFRGLNANQIAYNKVYNRSDEWHRENNISEYIEDDPVDIFLRQNSAKNWALAVGLDLINGVWWDPTKTGYLWMEMPTRTAIDPMDAAMIDMFKIDYDNRLKDSNGNYIESYEEYEDRMAVFLINYLTEHYDHPQEAIREGHLIIPSDIRHAAIRYIWKQNELLREDQEARENAGDFANDDELWDARYATNDKISDNKQIITDWLNNKDIPEWAESYDIRLTDWEITAFNSADNTPASIWDWVLGKEGVEVAYIEKGNHPTNLLPWTWVDRKGKGYNAETINYWWDENIDPEYVESLLVDENGNDRVINYGRDKGKTVREVLYGGEQPEGIEPEYTNYGAGTTGHRSWVPKEARISDETREMASKALNDVDPDSKDDGEGEDSGNGDKTTNKENKTIFPKSTYGGYKKSSYSSSSSYNPKIYSTHITSTHVPSTHISNTKTDPDSRSVNADRAATMYAKTPQDTRVNTYLRPGFETKGSREAYKRQDI